MIQIYTTPSCASCRKAKKWFDQYNIPYSEKNIFSIKLSKEDIFRMLANSENGLALVIIDYLQILAPYDIKLNDKQNIDKNILELKRLSRDYKIPIILISSLNRASYNNHSKTVSDVSMADFKESGAIEYSSDVLLGLQLKLEKDATKEDVERMKKKPIREMELIVLKNRNGERGQKLRYSYYARFNQYKELNI